MAHRHSQGEWVADVAVHSLGGLLALGAGALLHAASTPWASGDPYFALSLFAYASSLAVLLGCSALCSLSSTDAPRKAFLRRLNRAAGFVIVAGAFAPFSDVMLAGGIGVGPLVVVWTVAAAGAAHALLARPEQHAGAAIAPHLLVGCCGVLLISHARFIPTEGLILLGTGGLLYGIGVAVHLAGRLAYHNVVWRMCVLAALVCHFMAVVLLTMPV